MKTYEVVLVKSYIVKIQADNKSNAKDFSEYFTSDIKNLSTKVDEVNYGFKIESIDCKYNEVLEVNELYENN